MRPDNISRISTTMKRMKYETREHFMNFHHHEENEM
jgi:hypothetical protein